MHGSTGDIILLGTQTHQLEEFFFELTHDIGQDLGGSGSNLRTPSDCLGMSRCEYACYDSMALCYDLTQEYQDFLHRPAFPYKFKFKFDGCPNCCVASIARSDMSFIGTWRDDIKIDQATVKAYVGGEVPPNGGAYKGRDWGAFDINAEVRRPLSHQVHGLGRPEAEHLQSGMRPLHALHQRHAQGPADRR